MRIRVWYHWYVPYAYGINTRMVQNIDKEARTDFCMPRSKSLFVCARQGTPHLLESIDCELVLTREHYYI